MVRGEISKIIFIIDGMTGAYSWDRIVDVYDINLPSPLNAEESVERWRCALLRVKAGETL